MTPSVPFAERWKIIMPKEAEISCKNVFKCEDKSALKKEFNQKWIELINQLEKSKGQVLPVK